MSDPIQSAIQQLQSLGLVIDSFIADGKLRRIKSDDDKGSKKSGWYVAHEFTLDSGRSVITGRFGNWKIDSEPQAFQFDATFSDEERAKFREQQEKQRKAAEREKRERQKQAAAKASKIWPKLPTEGKSEYLARKKIHGFGCRYSKGAVIIPLYKGEQLTGLQFIYPDGSKKFLTGTEKQGASFTIEGDASTTTTVLCEGYATGCSIRMATGFNVVVCFDAGNLAAVAAQLAGEIESFIVAADNDHQGDGNTGLAAGADLARRFECVLRWPEFSDDESTGTDFNDLHVAAGLDAVRAVFARAPQAFPAGFDEPGDSITSNEPPAGSDPPIDDDWQFWLQRNKNDKIMPLSSNVERILINDDRWRDSLAYCDFSYRIIKQHAALPDMVAGEWEDADTARVAIWLSNTYGFEPARNKITDSVIVAAQRRRFHPVRDYLQGLEWDGTSRLDHWLVDIYDAIAGEGDQDPEAVTPAINYLSVVGSKILIGAVARVMKPGCKMDNVMILEGRQGLRKSTSIAVLFGDWFSDAPIPLGEKDAYQNIQGVWCCELAELDSFNKAETLSAKLFFSQLRDRYRPSYGQHSQDFPRQTVFIGTTNQGEYLKDYTGNRRYWPVRCQQVELEALTQMRDQLWAEALARYLDGEAWWPDDATRSVFEAEQDQRMQVDPWQYPIEDYLRSTTAEYMTAADVISNAIEKDKAQVTRADQTRLSPIMKALGWKNTRKRVLVGGQKVQRHVYIRTEKSGLFDEM